MKLNQSDPEYISAMQLYLSGDWKASREAFVKLAEKFDESPFVHLLLGNIYYSLGDLNTSVEVYQRAIDLNPEFGLAYYKMGVCHYRAGRLEEALASFSKVVELPNQSHAMAAYFVGLISQFLGDDEGAVRGFAQLRRESPQSLIANYYLAQLKIKHNQFEEAEELLEELVAETPEFAEVHYLLGVVNYRQHKITDAINYFRKALELNPGDERPKSRLMQLTDVQWP